MVALNFTLWFMEVFYPLFPLPILWMYGYYNLCLICRTKKSMRCSKYADCNMYAEILSGSDKLITCQREHKKPYVNIDSIYFSIYFASICVLSHIFLVDDDITLPFCTVKWKMSALALLRLPSSEWTTHSSNLNICFKNILSQTPFIKKIWKISLFVL